MRHLDGLLPTLLVALLIISGPALSCVGERRGGSEPVAGVTSDLDLKPLPADSFEAEVENIRTLLAGDEGQRAQEEALALLSEATTAWPGGGREATAHWLLGEAARGLHDADLAATELRLAMTMFASAEPGWEVRHAQSAEDLGDLRKAAGDYTEAEAAYKTCLELRTRALGEEHLDTATSMGNLAVLYRVLGRYDEGEALLKRSLEITRAALGDDHPDTLTDTNNLAVIYWASGRYEEAESLYRVCLTSRQRVLGAEHLDVAVSLNNLATLLTDMGRYAESEPLLLESLGIRRRLLGDASPMVAVTLNNIGSLYQAMGWYEEAEPFYQRSLDLRREALGETHPAVANALNNLAGLYQVMRRGREAELPLRQSLSITENTYGDSHPNTANALNNLGWLLADLLRYDEAEPLCARALELRRGLLGADHPRTAESLECLARVAQGLGHAVEAERAFKETLAIRAATLGNDHPATRQCQRFLVALYIAEGRYEEAEAIARASLAVVGDADASPETIATLSSLARLASLQGRPAEAARRAGEAVDLSKAAWMLHSPGVGVSSLRTLSERTLSPIHQWLTYTEDASIDPGEAYGRLLSMKGQVLHQQMLRRRMSHADPELFALFDAQLEATNTYSALMHRREPPNLAGEALEAWRSAYRASLASAWSHVSDTERALAAANADFPGLQAAPLTLVSEVAGRMPADSALVDLFVYDRSVEAGGEPYLVAFVHRPQTPVVRVELGPWSPITAAIEPWRKALSSRDNLPAVELRLGRAVAAVLWAPLAPHLDGAKTLFVSPDQSLAVIPLGALPGPQPGTRLIDERTVVLAPVPREIGAPSMEDGQADATSQERLLVVSDVDYNEENGTQGAPGTGRWGERGGALLSLLPLPAGATEGLEVARRFTERYPGGAVVALTGAGATEAAFRASAPGSSVLHLVTHGSFAQSTSRPQTQAASEAWRPVGIPAELAASLAFAGANLAPSPDRDDGLQTAWEVASLDLDSAGLAILSACETGLGDASEGEGLLGLQRAFQAAGVRTTIASLWRVDDVATQLLMVRFYENLWRDGLPRGEALRQAQLWMREQGAAAMRAAGSEPAVDKAGRLVPAYWAGWVLAGDWE